MAGDQSREEQVREVLADLQRASAAARATVAEITAELARLAPPGGAREARVT